MADVILKSVSKSYDATKVIHDIDLEINDGEFVVFVGPSGCGKSTLLRMIAGLEDISGGDISIGGRVVNDVAPAKRGVAMVFQTYALYPHMTVYNNMAFGLRQTNVEKNEIERKVKAAAGILHITPFLDRMPKALSGGQRQRVAIGRAIVREPQVFLFDEPLSNLDAALRSQTRLEIARLHERLKTTMIYVTHDQIEAMTLADKIVILNNGRIEQYGTPMEVYANPKSKFVAQFIGSPKMNFFSLPDFLPKHPHLVALKLQDGQDVGIRPEHLHLCAKKDALLAGKLEVVEQLGEYVLLYFVSEHGTEFIAKADSNTSLATGETAYFNASSDHFHIFAN